MGSDVYPDKPEAVLVYHASFWTSMSNQLHRSNIRMYIGMCMHVCIETETYTVNNMHYILHSVSSVYISWYVCWWNSAENQNGSWGLVHLTLLLWWFVRTPKVLSSISNIQLLWAPMGSSIDGGCNFSSNFTTSWISQRIPCTANYRMQIFIAHTTFVHSRFRTIHWLAQWCKRWWRPCLDLRIIICITHSSPWELHFSTFSSISTESKSSSDLPELKTSSGTRPSSCLPLSRDLLRYQRVALEQPDSCSFAPCGVFWSDRG